MPESAQMSMSQAMEKVVAEMQGPLPRDEFYRRVLSLWPSRAKDPRSSVRQNLVYGGDIRLGLVTLDKDTYAPLRLALRGVRFRIPVDRFQARKGLIYPDAQLQYFLPFRSSPPTLLDERGLTLTYEMADVPLPTSLKAPLALWFGRATTDALALAEWMKAHKVQPGDSVLATVLDWEKSTFQLEHEPQGKRRHNLIEEQNRALADVLYAIMEDSYDERVELEIAVPTAYARLPSARGYPGDDWATVVDRDPRMRNNGVQITTPESRIPLDYLFSKEEETGFRELPFSREDGQKVYRFRAAFKRSPAPWRVIEIQGRQTLHQLDVTVRGAFRHDRSDHLSEFTHVIPRGKNKKPREIAFGAIDPFASKPASSLRIAGLGLQPGATLDYVYDFGDSIEHRLILEAIDAPAGGTSYPRIAARNQPQYRPCVNCQAQGRESNALWKCMDCSGRGGQDVLICDACRSSKHKRHDVEGILY